MTTNKIPVALRIDPKIKEAGMKIAAADNRSFASYMEWLILQDVKAREAADQQQPKRKRA